MPELISPTIVQALVGVTVLLIAIYVGYRVIMALRDSTTKGDMSQRDLSREFEEMRHGGDIDEEELRKIKTVLGKTQHVRSSVTD